MPAQFLEGLECLKARFHAAGDFPLRPPGSGLMDEKNIAKMVATAKKGIVEELNLSYSGVVTNRDVFVVQRSFRDPVTNTVQRHGRWLSFGTL